MMVLNSNFVIINPKSAGGNTNKKIVQINEQLNKLGSFQLVKTEYKSHATELAKNALKEGYINIIAIGGDGTFNEVVNGFFENNELINQNACLGLIPAGTGSDFIKTIGVPNNIKKAIEKIVSNNPQRIDLGKVEFSTNSGKKIRYFLNIAEAGLGGEIVERVNNGNKAFGGFISFLYETIVALFIYKNKKVKITFDDGFIVEKIISNLVVGNGKFFGGGMKILPDASLTDGIFHILIIGDIKPADFFRNIIKIYFGTHLSDPNLFLKKTKKVSIESTSLLKVDIDGESDGFAPAEFSIVPNIIKVF